MGDGGRITVLYTLAGAAAGVLINVLFFASPGGKTDIDRGMLLALFGLLVGGICGSVFAERAAARPNACGRHIACGVVLLAALAGASVGWVVGDLRVRGPREESLTTAEHEEST